MKKLALILVVISLLATSSLSVFAQTLDKGNPPPKPATSSNNTSSGTKSTALPKFNAKSDSLNWKEEKNYTVYIGKTYKIPANSLLRSAITYSSSDKTILTISETGTVTPLKEGIVIIYATQGNVTIGKMLTVKVNPNGTANTQVGGNTGTAIGGVSSGRGTTTGVKTGNDQTFDFGNSGNTGVSENAPKLTQEEINWIIKEGRAYGESLGMTWSMEYRHGSDYPLSGYNTQLSTKYTSPQTVLNTIKHHYIDEYIDVGYVEFSIELKPTKDGEEYMITVYHG